MTRIYPRSLQCRGSGTRVLMFAVLFLMCLSAHSQAKGSRTNSSDKDVAPDLANRLSHYQALRMQFNSAGLSSREVKMVRKLIDAAQYLDDIYWRQSDPAGLELYKSVANRPDEKSRQLARFLRINAGRFDLIDENHPFVGSTTMSSGRGFYPDGTTKEDIEAFLKSHPEKRAEIYNPTTVVERRGDGLVAVPYHIAYGRFLTPAAKLLREAATLSPDKAFANFLRLRAAALLSDDYYPSDLAWLDLKDPKVDIIFAPYETYIDGLLGVKSSYGAAVMIRNEAESKKLAIFQKYIPSLQEALPLPKLDLPSKIGQPTPMEVIDVPFHSGDLNHGYLAVADNLPNDPRIHEKKGTKKLFFKNFLDARLNVVILPIARKILEPGQARAANGEGLMSVVMMHEICHGLGPAFSRVNDQKIPIREAIGPIFGATEEAKADVVGMFGLQWLMDHDAIPKGRAKEFYSSYVASILRTVRFGTAEPHGRAELMEFNYLLENKAVKFRDNRYEIDFDQVPKAIASLAKELLEIEATGDKQRAEKLFERYGKVSSELSSSLDRVKDVPVDVDPQFSFPQRIE